MAGHRRRGPSRSGACRGSCRGLDHRTWRLRRRRVRRLPPPKHSRPRQPGVEGLLGRHHPRRRHASRGAAGPGGGAGLRVRRPARRGDAGGRGGHRHTRRTICGGARRRLKDRFNEAFWDRRGWFVLGLDSHGRPIDSLTTNPGTRPVVRHRRRGQGSALRRTPRRPRPVDRLGPAHPGRLDGGLRPAQLPQWLGLAARHRPVHRRRGALRAAGTPSTCWSTVPSRPPGTSAGAPRSSSRVSRATTSRCRWPTPRRARRRPGRRHRCCCCVRTMLGLEPTADRSGVELARTDLSRVPDLHWSAWSSPGGHCR